MSTSMIIAFIVKTTLKLKDPKCLLVDKRKMKMQCINIMEYCSDVKKNEIMEFADIKIELQNILSDVTQT